jgi:FkbM family methyltransferase
LIDKNDLYLKLMPGYKLYLDKKDPGISNSLIRGKRFRKWHREPEFMDIIQMEVNEGDVAFDLGANIGYVTMQLANYVGPSGKVYAVEPSPRNFEILNESIKVNNFEKIIESFPLAVSSASGFRDLNISSESNLNSFIETKYTKETIKVETTSIDDFFLNKRFPNFIKMDIEGAEVDALAGIDKILDNDSCMKILMEIHPMYYEKEAFSDQLRRLFSLGFKTKYLVSGGVAKPDYFIKHGYTPDKIYRTGDFTRGVYTNVKEEHVIESCSNVFHDQFGKLGIIPILKKPYRIFNRKFPSPKIVRSIMLQRN